jgi:poly(hydroxyalkanoate) depolymerase family esterase
VNPDQMTAMSEALALTRAGRVAEATAVIQRALAGHRTGSASATHDGSVPGEVLWSDDGPGDRRSPHHYPSGGLRDLLRQGLAPAAAGATTSAPPMHLPGLPTLPHDGPRTPMPALPGRTSTHTHRGAAGERPYTVYVPTTGPGPRPLVVMLHGGTQTGADFAVATRMSELAEQHGFLVAYPEQVTSANGMRYWNWFEPGDQRRGGGEPAIIAGIVTEIAAAHDVDPDRVYIAGFSAGAAMAAVVGAAYPDVFAAVGVHSGLPHGCAHDVASGVAAMRRPAAVRPLRRAVPVIAFHGDADPIVAAGNAAGVVEQFTGGPVRGDTLVERGPGHPATRVVVRRDGAVRGELWTVHGSGHAWSGGVAGGSYTDPAGPNASAEMVRFFGEHPRRG